MAKIRDYIGSCSLVTKDIPAWSIAVRSPAKVVKVLLDRTYNKVIDNDLMGGKLGGLGVLKASFKFFMEAA